MKAVTIWQPWASLIVLLEKGNETRCWPTTYRGPLAIHAAQYVDREACETEPIKSILTKHGYTADTLPTGAVLGTVNLVECWSIGEDFHSGMPALYNGSSGRTKEVSLKESRLGFYAPGRYAWETTDVHRFAEPIPAKGKQRIWNWVQA